jgi:exonuclease III
MVDEGLINVNQAIVNQTSNINPPGTRVEDISNSLYTSNRGKVVHKSQSQKSSILTPHYTNKIFSVFHQNIRGLRDKNSELFGSLLPELPHILCLTEHFLTEQEITSLSLDTLSAKFCRKILKKGGSCIYALESLNFHNINLQKFCTEQDIEACAIKINLLVNPIYILSVYRSPKGHFRQVIKGIDNILNYLSKLNTEIIIYGDVNINYLAKIATRDSNWIIYLQLII